MAYRFNPPPNSASPPHGWMPPTGWEPSPEWGPAPEGWALWIDDETTYTTAQPAAGTRSPEANKVRCSEPGLDKELGAEVVELRAQVAKLEGPPPARCLRTCRAGGQT